MTKQTNISLPEHWKEELINLARIFSIEEGRTLTYVDLIRIAVKEKYNLKDRSKNGKKKV